MSPTAERFPTDSHFARMTGVSPIPVSSVRSDRHLTAYVYDAHTSGRTFPSREKLFEGSSKVGEDYSRCTEVSRRSTHCVGAYTLSHGTIQFSGTISTPSDTNRLSITSGTGSYKGVRGTVLTEYNKAGTKAQETLTFK